MKTLEKTKLEVIKMAYFNIGLQYYVLARHAVFCYLFPVNGNLFHHAIEMFLLAGLSSKLSAKQLKKKYHKHYLPQIWSDFKKIYQGKNKELGQYDCMILSYNKWEEVRYPLQKKQNTIMISDIRKKDKSKVLQPYYLKEDEYRVNLEEMDEFFKIISSTISVDPQYIKTRLLHGDNLVTYQKDNYHIVWEKRTPSKVKVEQD